MTPKKITMLALAGLTSMTTVATVLADTPVAPEKLVAERQAAMKADGKALKGSADLIGDKAIAALTIVQTNYTRLPGLFPTKDTITDKSEALPAIWDDFDKFSAIFKKGADAATDGIAAAKAGDAVKYKADIKLIAATCNECHTTFRAKRDD